MIHFMEFNMLGKQNRSYIIVDNAGKCNVNFYYDLIEPDKKYQLRPSSEILLLDLYSYTYEINVTLQNGLIGM